MDTRNQPEPLPPEVLKSSQARGIRRPLSVPEQWLLGIVLSAAVLAFCAAGWRDAHPSPAEAAERTSKQAAFANAQKAAAEEYRLKQKRVAAAATAALSIKRSLRNPDSVKWEEILATLDGSTVCMKYRAQNGFGGMNREAAAVVGQRLVLRRDDMVRECSKEPLYDELKDATLLAAKAERE